MKNINDTIVCVTFDISKFIKSYVPDAKVVGVRPIDNSFSDHKGESEIACVDFQTNMAKYPVYDKFAEDGIDIMTLDYNSIKDYILHVGVYGEKFDKINPKLELVLQDVAIVEALDDINQYSIKIVGFYDGNVDEREVKVIYDRIHTEGDNLVFEFGIEPLENMNSDTDNFIAF